jgi:hypothetical protein
MLTSNAAGVHIPFLGSSEPRQLIRRAEAGMSCRPNSSVALLVCIFLPLLQFNPALAQRAAPNPAENAIAPRTTGLPASKGWVPDDIDLAVPTVAADPACSLPDVLAGAGKRVEELVENVDRFTATEVLSHQSVDRSGKMRRPTTLRFEYLVSISKGREGYLRVEEFRNQSHSLDIFPSHIATVGTPSLILIFHPRYIGDFKTGCEGLGDWKGQPAWQVRFEQREDRPNHINLFVVNGRAYNGDLRGRAWILADSYQVVHLETDQKKVIPQIRLLRNHESIEYRPVSFPNDRIQLWLPSSVELYMDIKGQRFYRKHSFTDFKLFSVDTQYEVGEPKETRTGQQPAP